MEAFEKTGNLFGKVLDQESKEWFDSCNEINSIIWQSINLRARLGLFFASLGDGNGTSGGGRTSGDGADGGSRSIVIDNTGKVIDILENDYGKIYQTNEDSESKSNSSNYVVVGYTNISIVYNNGDIIEPVVVNESDLAIWVRPEDGQSPIKVKSHSRFYSPIDGLASPYHPGEVLKIVGDWNRYASVYIRKNGLVNVCYSCNNSTLDYFILYMGVIFRGASWRNDVFQNLLPYSYIKE